MIYGLLANLVLIAHLAYIAFVIMGGLLAIRWNRIWMLHLPGLLWAFLVEFLMLDCPLTSIENYFRNSAGQAGYDTGLLDYLLSSMIYQGLPQQTHVILGLILAAINAAVYFYLYKSGSFRLRHNQL